MKKGLLKAALLTLVASMFVTACTTSGSSSVQPSSVEPSNTSEVEPSPTETETPSSDFGSITGISITSPGAQSVLAPGATLQLTASVNGRNGADGAFSKEVTWAVAKVASGEKDADGKDIMVASDVASVSATGLVTALKEGSAKITATSVQDPTKVGTFSLIVEKTTYRLSITNEEDLKKDWKQYDDARTISLDITASDGSAVNVAALAAEGEIEVTATGDVFTVSGLGLNPTGHGTSTVTVAYGEFTTSIELTVDELVMATSIADLSSKVARKADPTAGNNYSAPEGQPSTWGLKAVVVGVTTGGAFLDDGTGIVYAYSSAAAELTVGNYVFGAVGGLQRYHQNAFELGSWKTINGDLKETAPTTHYSTLNRIDLTAAAYGAIDFDAENSVLNDWVPVKFTGTLFKSGTYFCFYPEDVEVKQEVATSATASAEKKIMIEFQATATDDLEVGKVYDVEAMANYDGKYCYVAAYASKVTEANVKPTALTAKLDVEHLYIGTKANIVTSFAPVYSTDKELTFTSSDEAKLTVDVKGEVTAVAAGEVNVTIALKSDPTVKVVLPITVEKEPDALVSVTLNKTETTLKVGQEETLTPTLVDAKGGDNHISTVKWSSSDETIATVDENGKVSTLKTGSATITCTTDGKNAEGQALTATCAVTVTGWTVADMTAAEKGDKVEFTAKAVAVNAKNLFVADATGGILVYDSKNNISGVAVGDIVSVKGELSSYNGGLQVINPTYSKVADADPITEAAATPITEAQIATLLAGYLADKDNVVLQPQVKVSLRTGFTSGSKFIEWTYGETAMETTVADGGMKAGNIYDIEGYINNVYSNKYICIVVTKATVVEGPVVITGESKVQIGKTVTLSAHTSGKDEDTHTWTSSDDTIATVDAEGKVTGVKEGKVTITATSVADTTKVATFEVEVSSAFTKVVDVKADATVSAVTGSYTGSFTVTANGVQVRFDAINNGTVSNGVSTQWTDAWRLGRKSNNASTAVIATETAIAESISRITLVVTSFGATGFESAKAYVSSDKETWTEAKDFSSDMKNGNVEIDLGEKGGKNLYFKIEIKTTGANSSNGHIRFSEVIFESAAE
ncbi:MAG: Ig-like domain-containing protein [Bacilli bacterium]|nr:Ig-like domain-containing protein [Bacilli bacterium]